MKGRKQTAGGQHERAPGENCAFVIHPVQVSSGDICHPNGTGRTVQELVAISRKKITNLIHIPAEASLQREVHDYSNVQRHQFRYSIAAELCTHTRKDFSIVKRICKACSTLNTQLNQN